MHVYSINSDKREKVVIILVVCTFIFEFAVQYFSVEEFILSCFSVESQNSMYMILKTGINMALPLSFYGGLNRLYNKWIWRWSICRKIHRIPDLNGEWEGTVKSALKSSERNVHTRIRQTWKTINVTTNGRSKSVSESATIEVNDLDEIFFRYAFKVDREGEHPYLGYNCLKLNGDILKGEYFTAKEIPNEAGKGSKGYFEIRKIN